jgi:hypothetical protein
MNLWKLDMSSDSITDEIRRIRHELAGRFGNDLDAILADIRRREATDNRTYVSLPPRRTSQSLDEPTDARAESTPSVANGSSTPPAR